MKGFNCSPLDAPENDAHVHLTHASGAAGAIPNTRWLRRPSDDLWRRYRKYGRRPPEEAGWRMANQADERPGGLRFLWTAAGVLHADPDVSISRHRQDLPRLPLQRLGNRPEGPGKSQSFRMDGVQVEFDFEVTASGTAQLVPCIPTEPSAREPSGCKA